jgi:hypothetical protein
LVETVGRSLQIVSATESLGPFDRHLSCKVSHLDGDQKGSELPALALSQACRKRVFMNADASIARIQMNWLANMMNCLARGIAALSPSCKEASRLQSEARDHKLPILRRIGLWIHLVLCKWCRRYRKQIRSLRDAVHEHPDELEEHPPQKLPDAARERMKQRLRAEEE